MTQTKQMTLPQTKQMTLPHTHPTTFSASHLVIRELRNAAAQRLANVPPSTYAALGRLAAFRASFADLLELRELAHLAGLPWENLFPEIARIGKARP